MSEFLVIFTLLILSPNDLKLISEKINVRTGHSEGKTEFAFENTKSGFSRASDKMNSLKGNEPSRECLINLSETDGGFYGLPVKNSPKNLGETKGLNPTELADLCKKAVLKK
ncbi:hypothetical protein [Leptospira kmetyi]|uniref:Uncharacterized protein n=1 Tax=Leptospira kmetyi TaxID=408139 RepID=A0A5F1Y1R7_9LEPT|nr:hypothetical protein [Leptospira kmetyi]AYV57721.1 hypothetical protein EFP84_18975 [Leptospira kmetyi]EQA55449.1 hypothetical protein LEP1GSC052_0333 [Leptospira kmetyi serovar Malaysia str. Bejo-Iso9]PJZ29647.1 hypothetical protein CH378_11900 [Leptospira kmetyi]TGK23101.1 hypothetical protein EHO62_00555 [Leptospira kmetyi]TGK33591.1 hypothetical protein EHO66_03530 [Leptospira kmetyi]